MALDLGSANAPSDSDGLFTDRLRLLPERLDHQDLAEPGRDPRPGHGWRLRRYQPDRLPAGLEGSEPVSSTPQVAPQPLLEKAEAGRICCAGGQADSLAHQGHRPRRHRLGSGSSCAREQLDPVEPGPS